mgnify:FL=1
MSKITRRATLRCYGQLMRVGLSWPIPPGREDRALRSAIIDRVRAGFQENKQETNPAKITALLKYAKEQLLALETIHKNKFSSMVLVAEISVISNAFHQYPFTDMSKIPKVVKKAAMILTGKKLQHKD